MPGTNAGTGQLYQFRCSSCRQGPLQSKGRIEAIELTGRKRFANARGGAGGRNSTHTREYICKDCAHVGWSRHKDLERLERVRPPSPIYESALPKHLLHRLVWAASDPFHETLLSSREARVILTALGL